MREVIATGKTVEEATENGCRELGLSRDEVSVEILEMPVKKLFKSTPAKVKVTADTGEGAPAQTPPAAPAPAQVERKPAPAREPASAPKAPPPPQAAAAPAAEAKQPVLPAEPEVEINIETSPRVKMAADYLTSIFSAMGAGDVQLSAFQQGDATLLRLEGEQIADKMEIKGETIQALSYLIDRAVNSGVDKKDSDYLRIRLDVAGYRGRRESELIALANKVGKEVARTGRSKTLSPMNPYERLIVHTAISAIDGIVSESIGSDTERRVVVKSLAPDATDGGDWRPPRKPGGGNNSRGGRGGGRGDRDRGGRSGGRGPSGGGGDRGRPPRQSSTPEREYADKPRDPNAAPIVPEQREAIRDGEDLPLYGKIEL